MIMQRWKGASRDWTIQPNRKDKQYIEKDGKSPYTPIKLLSFQKSELKTNKKQTRLDSLEAPENRLSLKCTDHKGIWDALFL